MNKNKRGLAASELVIIMLVLVSFVLIAGAVNSFISKAAPKEAEILCQNSINLRAMSTVNIGSADVRLVPPLCKTIDVEITGNREEIKDQLAYLMARCWWMFGEGRHEELFENDFDSLTKVLAVDKVENDCFLCYNAMIDQKNIDGGIISAKEMYDYLIENDHRQIKGVSYLNYIQSYGGPGLAAVADGIDGKQPYGIVFMSKNKKMEEGSWLGWAGTAAFGVLTTAGMVVCVATVACGVIAGATSVTAISVAAAGTVAATYGAYNQFKADYYGGDRDVSVVTLDHLNGIKAGGCMVNDLAGK